MSSGTGHSIGAPRTSTWRATLWVAAKELRTAFRDRQTTLYVFVLPIVLYPFLFWCMLQTAMFVQGRRERTEVEVAIAAARGVEVPAGLADALSTAPLPPGADRGDERLAARMRTIDRVSVAPLRQPMEDADARAWAEAKGAKNARRASDASTLPDAVVYLPEPGTTRVAEDGAGDASFGASDDALTVYYDSTDTASELAKRRVVQRLPSFAKRLREEHLPAGKEPSDLVPFLQPDAHDVSPPGEGGAYLLSFMLPMLLVVMTVLGAFFPAVDVTAGERERNTAETTMLLPVPRLAVHQGKILAVCASALIATSLNLAALALSAGHLLQMMPRTSKIDVAIPVSAFASIAPLALLFAFFVSAALVGIASLARTFKEGQALLGPVQMVFILPALAGAIPGLELTPALACVPVVNVVLAFRALINHQSMAIEYAITAGTLFVAALLAIVVAVRLLSRETWFAPQRAKQRRKMPWRTA